MAIPTQTKKCPHCAEEINIEAKKCKHCGEFLEGSSATPRGATKVRKMSYWKALAHCITIGIGMMVMSFIILFPLLLLGMLLVVTSPIMAFFLLEGDCPYCGNMNVIVPPKTTVKCRHCKQRSVLKEMSLLPLNNFSVKS